MSKKSDRDLGDVRPEYGSRQLDESMLPVDPMELIATWLEEAGKSGNPMPTAMTLATVERNGQPSARVVLLKKVDDGRLIFYTNYHSRKSREIRNHARVAAHFFWPELERQVKISGIARPVDDEDSDRYFHSRPKESNISAWASPQSEVVPDRQYLEQEFEKYRRKYEDAGEIPRPAYWGGYAIIPSRIEFWQGGRNRLHDRIEYNKKEERWSFARLAP
jgi:pyridoxamine 5'-phosphate oxidase